MASDRDTSDTDDSTGDGSDAPSLRQRLHSATGDREAEADALADRTEAAVSEEDAEIAVKRAHGEIRGGEPEKQTDLASPEEAEAVKEERSG